MENPTDVSYALLCREIEEKSWFRSLYKWQETECNLECTCRPEIIYENQLRILGDILVLKNSMNEPAISLSNITWHVLMTSQHFRVLAIFSNWSIRKRHSWSDSVKIGHQ